MRGQVRDIYQTLKTILIGMRITLQYAFARTITVQYPDIAPTVQPRYRGFHWYEIEKCSACKACARACPVDCIAVENSGPRKIDRETGFVRGGAMKRYAIDYSKCMFCGLCLDPCPTHCLHMDSAIHDISGFSRREAVVEFTDLAKQGLRTPQPLWMQKRSLPAWAEKLKTVWLERAAAAKDEMYRATTEQAVAKPAPKPAETPNKSDAPAAKPGDAPAQPA